MDGNIDAEDRVVEAERSTTIKKNEIETVKARVKQIKVMRIAAIQATLA